MTLTVQPARTYAERDNLKLLDEFTAYACEGIRAALTQEELKGKAREFIETRRVK